MSDLDVMLKGGISPGSITEVRNITLLTFGY